MRIKIKIDHQIVLAQIERAQYDIESSTIYIEDAFSNKKYTCKATQEQADVLIAELLRYGHTDSQECIWEEIKPERDRLVKARGYGGNFK